MKYIILVPDGMADYPIEELGGKTPLEASHKTNMDFIAQNGQVGVVKTIPENIAPGSDVANLSILGYDPKLYYTGRGPLEAANLSIDLKDNEIAFRCNLITVEEDKLFDYSAGHISTKEAQVLIKFLDEKLGNEVIRFYSGVSYRHLMVMKTDNDDILKIKCLPPHDIKGWSIQENLPQGKDSEILIDLMQKSRELLAQHEINHVRIDLKENPANMIWLWGQGRRPNLPKFRDMFQVEGAVISAVDLIKGLGKTIGLEVINVPGVTAYYDTNYKGKAEYALKALKTNDFVFVHVEATDEAGHNGDLRMKITCIERFDSLVVGTILKHMKRYKNFRIMILPDHATPLSLRTHTSDPVNFCLFGKGISPSGLNFSDRVNPENNFKFNSGHELMEYFMKA
ncbi:MAG: cofactor-independent phosphoglycerate mutase [Candidatus Omnitrophota bacterium]|nr:cofactor-independent phosphoglycerate mutase [Candidatus Omnitrophota bacterium]